MKTVKELRQVIEGNEKVFVQYSGRGCFWCELASYHISELLKKDEWRDKFNNFTMVYCNGGSSEEYIQYRREHKIDGVPAFETYENGILKVFKSGYSRFVGGFENKLNDLLEWNE